MEIEKNEDLEITPEKDAELGHEILDFTESEEEDTRLPPPYFPPLPKLETFADANFHPQLAEVIAKVGWTTPTPVQAMCLPASLSKRDLAGFAQTGTGKTGVFLMTYADRFLKNPEWRRPSDGKTSYPSCFVLAPTRELAMQIESDGQTFFEHLGMKSLAVLGGIDYDKQARALTSGNVDVVVATPGRLKDYVQKGVVSLDNCQIFVCDEVDRMFDMGFIDDVSFFLERLPETAQRLIFSATTNPEIKELAFEYLNHPEYISVSPEIITPETIEQHAVIVDAPNKLKVILGLLREEKPECSIIFTNTKLTAEWLHYKLTHNGIECDLITGDLPQKKRIALIQKIKQGKIKALIATDVASRGLHISRVTHVFNFDVPDDAANYVHRIGRTARAGARGSAYSLICDDYGENFAPIQELLGAESAPRASWFSEKYLEIEDKAPNPYKKPEAPRPERERPAAPARVGARASSGQSRPEPRQEAPKSKRPANPSAGGRFIEGVGYRTADYQPEPAKPGKHRAGGKIQSPAKTQSGGTWALLKKLVNFLLGRKS